MVTREQAVPESHKCAAWGCTRRLPVKLLMCARHWRMVPISVQREIWALYRRYQQRGKEPPPEYYDAVRRAVTAVQQQEGMS